MKTLSKALLLQGILAISLGIVLAVLKHHKLELSESLLNLNQTVSKIQKLSTNKEFYDFAANHLFRKDKVNFKKFLKSCAKECFINISNVSCGDSVLAGKVKKTTYEIDGFAWHDSCVFQLIQKISDFSPGFAKIFSVSIEQFAEINNQKPVFKMRTLCDLYSQ